ncbi:hypothetical protein CHU98_g10708 [Xylaria longipes]|nr:hypothetical protein CHU98_g10708 [Xylaria longipes]
MACLKTGSVVRLVSGLFWLRIRVPSEPSDSTIPKLPSGTSFDLLILMDTSGPGLESITPIMARSFPRVFPLILPDLDPRLGHGEDLGPDLGEDIGEATADIVVTPAIVISATGITGATTPAMKIPTQKRQSTPTP